MVSLTEDAHDILALADLLRKRLVASLERGLLLRDESHADLMHDTLSFLESPSFRVGLSPKAVSIKEQWKRAGIRYLQSS